MKIFTILAINMAIIIIIEDLALFFILKKSMNIWPVIGIIIVTIAATTLNIWFRLKEHNIRN